MPGYTASLTCRRGSSGRGSPPSWPPELASRRATADAGAVGGAARSVGGGRALGGAAVEREGDRRVGADHATRGRERVPLPHARRRCRIEHDVATIGQLGVPHERAAIAAREAFTHWSRTKTGT